MKRWSVVLLVLTVLLAAVAAPGLAAEKTTITIWTEWIRNKPAFDILAAEYEAQHPNIKIDWQIVNMTSDVGIEKFITSIAAGSPPDLVTLSAGNWMDIASQGVLEPLDRYVSRTDLKSKYYPQLWNSKMLNGKIYGIPAFEGGPSRGLVYNKDLFAEAGLPPLDPDKALTWDELGALNRKLARTEGDGRLTRLGFYPRETAANGLGAMVASFNVDWLDRKTDRGMLDRPELVEAMESLKRNFFDPWGYAAVEALTKPGNPYPGHAKSWFSNRQTAALIAGYWAADSMTHGTQDNIGVTWAPGVDNLKIQGLGSWALFMPKDSKHKDEAWELLRWLASPAATKVLYDNFGWLGGLNKDLPRYIDLRGRDNLLWYINSLERADVEFGLPPSPYDRDAGNLWTAAYNDIMSGKTAAQVALAEANRQLNAKIQEIKARK